MRLVCLVPGAAEFVYDLGLGGCLVGRARECVWPAEARLLPVVAERTSALSRGHGGTGSAAGCGLRSAGSERLQGAPAERLAVQVAYGPRTAHPEMAPEQTLLVSNVTTHPHRSALRIDVDALAALEPDLVLLEETCPTCLAAYQEVTPGLAIAGTALGGRPVRLVSVSVRRLHDAVDQAVPVGALLGQEARAAALAKLRAARLLALRMHVGRYLSRSGATRPRTLLLVGQGPFWTPGLWVPDVLDAAGAIVVAGQPGGEDQPLTAEEIAAARPDVLLLGWRAPDPAVAETAFLTEAPLLGARLAAPALSGTPAVLRGRAWAVNRTLLLDYPGLRLIAAVEALLRIVIPEALGANGTPPHPEQALRLLP